MKKALILILLAILLVSCAEKAIPEKAAPEAAAPAETAAEEVAAVEPEEVVEEVAKPNSAPVISPIADKTIKAGELFTLQVGAVDKDGDALTYAINTETPFAGILINKNTGVITWQTGIGDTRTYVFTVSVSDGKMISTEEFELNILKADPKIYNLILWLTFDDGTAADSSKEGEDGIVIGDPVSTLGKKGKTLVFDGNDYVEILKTDDLIFKASSFSIALWVKSNASDGVQRTFVRNRDGDNEGLVIRKSADEKIEYEIQDNRGDIISFKSDVDMSDLRWHHVVLVREYGNSFRFYVDGAEKDYKKDELRDVSTTLSWFIGRSMNAKNYWKGAVDEVQIYNRALTKEEVISIYNS